MKKLTFTPFVLLAVLLTSFITIPQNKPLVLEGVIITDPSGKPANEAHVYVIHGEEETLTDNRGYFKLETWQKPPFKVTVAYRDHRTTTVVVSDVSRKQTIRVKHL